MSKGLRYSGIPLGGLGTGSVELRSDGLFHEWQIMNNKPWGGGPELDASPNSLFFGLQVRGKSMNRSMLLATPPAPDYLINNPYDTAWLEFADSIESTPRFPFTDLKYDLGTLPIRAQLEAFSPFIPLDAKNSGLPLAFLTFTLTNTGKVTLSTTLFGGMRNLTCYTNPDVLSQLDIKTKGKKPRIVFGRECMPEGETDSGTMVLGMIDNGKGTTTYAGHSRPRDLWDALYATGKLENKDMGSLETEMGNVGATKVIHQRRGQAHSALARTVELAPKETRTITVVLAWHFPNMFERDYAARDLPGSNIGHRYAEWFDNAEEVFDYGAKNFDMLRSESVAFLDAYYESDQPRWLLDAVNSQLTTMVKASWWDRAGRFGIWEGLGCCGLQTTDVGYYGSFPTLQLFPEIEMSQMRLTRDNMEAKGKIPHMMPGTFACADVDHRMRIDLIPQFILMVWRDVLWTGDTGYLREMWTTVKESLAFFITTDTDGDGLPNNSGPDQTYDQFPLKGTSSFVGFLYLGALEATAQMAALLKEKDYETELRERAKTVSDRLHEQLWNGEYFRLSNDITSGEINEGVMVDQLNADWFMRQTTGQPLVDPKKCKSSLKAILEHCSRPHGYLANCAWPKGDGVEIGRHTADQANWPWSGVEYAFAAYLFLAGMKRDGLRVMRDVWDRYERTGLRFNHIECGGHYYRAMSSWAAYLGLAGYTFDALHGVLRLRVAKKNRTVINGHQGWGMLTMKSGAVEIVLHRGSMTFKTIELEGPSPKTAKATLNGKAVKLTLNGNRIEFAKAVKIGAGKALKIELR